METQYRLQVIKQIPNPKFKPAPKLDYYGGRVDERQPDEMYKFQERVLDVMITEEEWDKIRKSCINII